MSQISVVDADGHVTEPMSLWTDYVEPAYRERAPRPVLDERGRPCMLLDGRLVMRHAMLLTLGPDYDVGAAKFHAGGWDPQARLRDMDSEGIDLAVLFPSVAFYLPETSDAALTAALGVPVTVHEGLSDGIPTLGRDRFENPAMLHVLSHPFEQMAACAGLILTGVLERHPTLRVAFLESGSAWLPYWLDRMDGHL